MVLDLKSILNGANREIKIDTSLDYTGEEYRGEKLFATPCSVKGTVLNKAEVTRLDISCSVSIEKVCDRCGKLTKKDYVFNINRVLVSELQGEEYDDIVVVENNKLDLYDFCLGEILLDLPMKFLCREDCKGICTLCGTDLNFGKCKCSKENVNPVAEALAKLLEDDSDFTED